MTDPIATGLGLGLIGFALVLAYLGLTYSGLLDPPTPPAPRPDLDDTVTIPAVQEPAPKPFDPLDMSIPLAEVERQLALLQGARLPLPRRIPFAALADNLKVSPELLARYAGLVDA